MSHWEQCAHDIGTMCPWPGTDYVTSMLLYVVPCMAIPPPIRFVLETGAEMRWQLFGHHLIAAPQAVQTYDSCVWQTPSFHAKLTQENVTCQWWNSLLTSATLFWAGRCTARCHMLPLCLQQCGKTMQFAPSPNHHHFDRWYKLTTPSHEWFMALFYPH